MKLFTTPTPPPSETCQNCEHRQRWQCGSRVVQYCGARKSNRTENGLLKITRNTPACTLFDRYKGPDTDIGRALQRKAQDARDEALINELDRKYPTPNTDTKDHTADAAAYWVAHSKIDKPVHK